MDNQVADAFDKHGLKDQYKEMNGIYSKYKDELAPIASTWRKYKNPNNDQGKRVFEQLANQLSANPGKNQVRKTTLKTMQDLAKKTGDTNAVKFIQGLESELHAADAAIALNPLARKGAAEAGIFLYGGWSGNLPLIAAASGKAFVGNARMHQTALRANHALWETLKQVKGMPRAQTEFLLSNPNAATQFLRTVKDAPQTKEAVSNIFNSMYPQPPQRGPGDE